MEAFLLWIVGIIVCIIIVLLFLFSKANCRRSQLPPGSLGWPFLGETVDFITCAYSDRPETFMDKRRRRYGKVFKSHLFGTPTIVSTDAAINRLILQSSDAKFFVPFYPKSLTELMGKSSILVINGSLQRRIHALIGSFFKSHHLKSQICRDMERYVEQAMEKWTEEQPIYIQEESKNIAFEVLVRALISLNAGPDMEILRRHFKQFISGLMALPLKVPGSQLHRSLQAKKEMVKMLHKIIDSRRSCGASTTIPNDVMDVMIINNGGGEELRDDLVVDNIIDMMIPGEDSVPILITLAVKFLSDCPAALQQLTEENLKHRSIKTKTGEPLIWGDYFLMPFTQCVITETLRMGNIISGVMRKAVKDMEIKGHFIPKGWCFFAYFRSVHFDEDQYDSPYKFNPWRWQDKDTSCGYNFTPFGGGQRLCPGLDIARLEASIFLYHLVNKFRWIAKEDRAVNFPTVRMKNKLPIWVKKREVSS